MFFIAKNIKLICKFIPIGINLQHGKRTEKMRYTKSAITSQYIIEKVAPIFNKKGYVGTSLSDMTEATGLTKGSIYGNFKNKDGVAIEALKYNISIITDSFFIEIANSLLSPINRLYSLPKLYHTRYEKIVAMGGCPIINTAADADDTHPQLRQITQDIVSKIEKALIAVIKEGILKGEIKPNTNPNKIAQVIISLVEGGFMMAKLIDDKKYFDHTLEHLREIIERIQI